MSRIDPIVRFWAKVTKTESCWLWTGGKTIGGYGTFGVSAGVSKLAHRFAYELSTGPIPAGYDIDHLCRTRHCVNPAHLEAVSHRVNMLRGDTCVARNAAKTRCRRGHELAGDNLRMNARGDRVCRLCANLRVLELKRTNPEYARRQKALLREWIEKNRRKTSVA